jgi:S1-C subfamily serine protease
MEEDLVKGQRVWWVLGALAALGLALGAGVVAGGGLVYALTRSGGRLPFAAAAQGRDPGYGVVVASVEVDGPADKAGIVRGDVLLEVAGQRIENTADLVSVLGSLETGSEINVVVLHGDDQRTLSLTPGEQNGRAYLGLTPCGGPIAGSTVQQIAPGELSTGALLVEVTAGSPAEQAGLQAGDVITAVDGQPVDADNDLASRITAHKPGDTISLTVERSGEEARDVTVTLGAQPEDENAAYLGVRYTSSLPGTQGGQGMPFQRFRNLPFDELPFSFPEGDVAGVIVQHVIEGSPAEAAGLQAGDVITALDGNPVESAQTLTESIAGHTPGDVVTLTVVSLSDGSERQVEVTLAEHPEDSSKAYLGVYLGSYFQMPSTEEGQGLLQRWFFGPPSGGDDGSGGFQFRWPPTGPRDAPSDDDVGSL